MRALNTADVFAFARLLNKADIVETLKNEIGDLIEGKKAIKKEEITEKVEANALGLTFALISAFGKRDAEKELYEFLSGPFEMKPKEIAQLPPEKTVSLITELISQNNFSAFFKNAAGLSNRIRK